MQLLTVLLIVLCVATYVYGQYGYGSGRWGRDVHEMETRVKRQYGYSGYGALIFISQTLAFRQQSVGVRGRLMCGNQPLNNTKVKLWNKNKIGSDDQLADGFTDSNGNFQLSGGIGSLFGIDVHFKIYHDCDDGIKPCQRKVDLRIPSEYVTRTSEVQQWFEAGTMNMQFKFPDEERSCIN